MTELNTKIMKTSIYGVAILALAVTCMSCKKETTKEEEMLYETTPNTSVVSSSEWDADSVAGSEMTDVQSGSGSNKSESTKNVGSSGNTKSSGSNTPLGAAKKPALTKNGVDMTTDTIMTPAGKGGPSATPGSGNGNTRGAKPQGTGTGNK